MSEKTPLEIAREVWPLEWYRYGGGNLRDECIRAAVARYDVYIYGPDEEDPTWQIYVDGKCFQDADLRTALTEARRLTAERLREALDLCAIPRCTYCDREDLDMEWRLYTHRDSRTLEDVPVCSRCRTTYKTKEVSDDR